MDSTQQLDATDRGDATARLDAAVRSGLSLSESTDVHVIAYGEIEEWDSVAHMQLVASLEAAFDVMIDTDDVIAMSDYDAIRRILRDNHGIPLDP